MKTVPVQCPEKIYHTTTNPQPKAADRDLVKCRSTERSSGQVQPRRRRRVKVWVARCRGRSYLESVAVADVVCTFGQRGIWESVPPITFQCHSVLPRTIHYCTVAPK